MSQSPIKSDETVTFFPTYATLDDAAAMWHARVHGWIFETSLRGSLVLSALRVSLDLSEDQVADEIFQRRARPFAVDNERGKAIPVIFDLDTEPEQVVLDKSAANGHFFDRVAISKGQILSGQANTASKVSFRAVVRPGDQRSFSGDIDLISPEGLSVISDIDDTIKDSNVSNQKELLRNTFLRPFTAIPGMAERYRAWRNESPETFAVHYVTASPWQLFDPLNDFLRDEGFPAGTMHMKLFRLKDRTMFDLFRDQTKHKTQAISEILRDFPRRRFVLVGDAGEQDPEVYGTIARQHPRQVAAIYIRNLAGLMRDADRFKIAFADVPGQLWSLFAEGSDLPESIAGLQADDANTL
ncbi:MAG: DUF2183 domain-containing protein [Pirellulales bacterium]|nr:DUF2183 domain-containing protein [Pirellulales bacterium]